MEKRTIDYNISIPVDHQTTVVAEPGKGSFHLPPPTIMFLTVIDNTFSKLTINDSCQCRQIVVAAGYREYPSNRNAIL